MGPAPGVGRDLEEIGKALADLSDLDLSCGLGL